MLVQHYVLVMRSVEAGFDVIGLDNDSRSTFFGAEASTAPVTQRLLARTRATFAGWTRTSATVTT